MKTIRNEYRDLKKENDLVFSTLTECDRDTITDILSTIDNTRGIGYEVELVRKDLIAMAAQAEARRDYLPSVIGDVEIFKRNLLASMPRPKLADYMADSLVWLCTFALVSTATYTVMGRAWDCYYDAVWLVLCIAIMMPSAWLLQRIVPAEWAASTEKGVRYGAITATMMLLWFVEFLARRQMGHAAAARGGPAQPCGSHPVRRGTGSAAYLAQPSPQRACRKATLAGCDGEIKVSPDGAEPSGDALPSPAGEGGRTQ